MKERKNHNPPVYKNCIKCGKAFLIAPSVIKLGHGKYCSTKCRTYTGENNPKWRGGRILRGGYVYIYSPEHPNATNAGYICEHRLVMEAHLMRYLKNTEVIHHLNTIRDDNRLENLTVVSPADHNTIHHKGVKHSPEHIRKRFANRKKADMSKAKRDSKGNFIKR